MDTKTLFKLDTTQFFEFSSIPLTIRVRLALNKLGMKFEDDNKLSSIVNTNPKPLGTITRWEEPSEPFIIFYTQELN